MAGNGVGGWTAGRLGVAALLALIAHPYNRLAAQCPDGSLPPCLQPRRAPAANSVAVAYFENHSPDTTDVYLADGLTEDVTAKLGDVSRLVVTSSAAMRHFRQKASGTPADLGRALNVTFLVSGSVQRSGPHLRVTVELVRASTGARVWGQQYNRETNDLLTIQEEIAEAVATGIAGRLFPAEQQRLATRSTRNPAAYDHYLRGNKWLWRRDEHSVLSALAEYEAALQQDSTFAAARGRLAYTYGVIMNYSYTLEAVPPDSVLARGLAAADRAIREDSTVPDAWLGRGIILFFDGRNEDLASALQSVHRAVVLDPTNDEPHAQYSALLRRMGRFAEAEAESQRAREINPWGSATSDLAFLYYSLRHYAAALTLEDTAIAVDSGFSTNFVIRAWARAGLGDVAGALKDALTSLRLAVPSERFRIHAVLAQMEYLNGQTERANRRLDSAFAAVHWPGGVPDSAVPVRNAYDPALAALVLGRRDVALTILEKASPRGPWLWSYLIFPGFDSLRSNPRFITVYEESKPPGAPEVPR